MKEKIAVFGAILLGVVVGLFATISLIIDAFVLDNLAGTIIDLVVMGFSYLTAWMSIRYVLMEKSLTTKLTRNGIYNKGECKQIVMEQAIPFPGL